MELQAETGMTLRGLGDREQCQAIEAGDSIALLQRALPPEALAQVLSLEQLHHQEGIAVSRDADVEDAHRVRAVELRGRQQSQ